MGDSKAEILEVSSRIFHSEENQESFTEIVAKCSVLLKYDIEPTPENMESFTDLDGQSVVVQHWRGGGSGWYSDTPQPIDSQDLDHDIYVFVDGRHPLIYGWTTVAQIEEHDVHWIVDTWGTKVGYNHFILARDLAPMPEHCLFIDTCEHFDRWGGLWDVNAEAFECFGCNRFIHNWDEREFIRGDLAPRYLPPPSEEGPKRQGFERDGGVLPILRRQDRGR